MAISWLQFGYVLTFLTSLSFFFLVGQGVLFSFGCRRLGTGPLFSIFLGQFAAVLLFYLYSPAATLLHFMTGFPLTGVFFFLVWIALGWSLIRSKPLREECAAVLLTRPGLSFAILTVGVLTARYFSASLEPPGHDTFHHYYWARHVFDAGYVPLNAWHTTLLENYTRGFAVLTSLWFGATGTEYFVGATVRMLPFLQTALPLLAAADLLLSHRGSKVTIAVVGMALFYLLISGTLMVVPFPSLDGTARYAGNAVLSLPFVLAFAALLLRRPTFLLLAFAALPVSGALAFTLNPSLGVQALFAGLPLAIPVLAVSAFQLKPALKRSLLSALVGAWLAWIILIQDPWVLNKGLALSQKASLVFESLTGLSRAVPGIGQASKIPTRVACADLSCWASFVKDAALQVPKALTADTSFFPFTRHLLRSARGFMIVLEVFALLILVGLLWRRKKEDLAEIRPAFLALLGVVLCGAGQAFSATLTARLCAGSCSFDQILLREYSRDAGAQVSLLGLGIGLLSLVWGAARNLKWEWFEKTEGVSLRRAVTVALCLVIVPVFASRFPSVYRGALPELTAEDLSEFRKIETFMGPGRVAIAADYSKEGEYWVGPADQSLRVLSYSSKRLVFSSYLGESALFSHGDVKDGFCNPEPARRQEFLRSHGIKKIYVWYPHSAEKAFLSEYKICGLPLRDFGVQFPPEASNGEQSLYRIRD